jgi:hypothetical protein
MSKMLFKLYETDYSQRAPSQANRTVFSPGKLSVNNSEAGLRMSFHVPFGNTSIETQLRDNLYHAVWMDPQITVTQNNYITPTIEESVVEIVKEVGVEGTHQRDETVMLDIHFYERSIGGYGFESPV